MSATYTYLYIYMYIRICAEHVFDNSLNASWCTHTVLLRFVMFCS